MVILSFSITALIIGLWNAHIFLSNPHDEKQTVSNERTGQ